MKRFNSMAPGPRSAFRRLLARFAPLALLLPLAGCEMMDQTLTPMMMMSPEKELALGKQVQTAVEKDVKFVNDPTVVGFVRRLGSTVLAAAPQQPAVPVQFFVIQNKEINAFAIPGGNIYVQTGLLDAADDEAEVAGVMAHELGHVVFRHGAKQVSREQGMSMLEQMVLGQQAGAVAQLAAGLVSKGVILKYSRQDELEADSIAVPTLQRANYDPTAMVTFFQKLEAKYGSKGGGGLMVYASTHPATPDRIARVQAQIASSPPGQRQRPITELRRVQARMKDLGLSGQ